MAGVVGRRSPAFVVRRISRELKIFTATTGEEHESNAHIDLPNLRKFARETAVALPIGRAALLGLAILRYGQSPPGQSGSDDEFLPESEHPDAATECHHGRRHRMRWRTPLVSRL